MWKFGPVRQPALLRPRQRRRRPRSRCKSCDRALIAQMNPPVEVHDPESGAQFLRALGRSDGQVWPIAEAALALAALANPGAAVARYRQELHRIARDLG